MANEFTRLRVAKASYSFTTDGGATGTIIPSISDIVPSGATIVDVKSIVNTAFTTTNSDGQIAWTAGGVTIKAAETTSNCVYGTGSGAIVDVIRAGNAGSTGTAKYIPITTTSSAQIKLVLTVDAITAGAVDMYVFYID